jgi:hypothetical protein
MQNLPAFRARIRHLRNLDVPAISRPGRGQQVTYTRVHALQLLLALEAELMGIPPKFAASLSRSRFNELAGKADSALKDGRKFIVSVDPKFSFNSNDAAVFVNRSEEGIPLVDEYAHRVLVINLATSISLLDRALKKAVGHD